MSVSLREALSTGWDTVQTPNGVTLTALFTILMLVFEYTTSGILQTKALSLGFSIAPASFQVSSNMPVNAFLSLILFVVLILVTIVAMRLMTIDETEEIPESLYKEQLLLPFVSMIVTGILYIVSVAIGAFILVLPGIFILISCCLYGFVIANQGGGPIKAFKTSWGLTRGNRLVFLGLILVLIGFNTLLGIGPAYVGLGVLGTLGIAFGLTYSLAVMGHVYTTAGGKEFEY